MWRTVSRWWWRGWKGPVLGATSLEVLTNTLWMFQDLCVGMVVTQLCHARGEAATLSKIHRSAPGWEYTLLRLVTSLPSGRMLLHKVFAPSLLFECSRIWGEHPFNVVFPFCGFFFFALVFSRGWFDLLLLETLESMFPLFRHQPLADFIPVLKKKVLSISL